MKESILHFVWQFKLFSMRELKTTDGHGVDVIDVGRPNIDSGPDFFNAKLKIDGTIWAGNIEIHNQSSDWKKHKHHEDKAYDNVILHVVNKADKEIRRTNGALIPQMELTVPEYIVRNYDELFSVKKWIQCEEKINTFPPVLMSGWKNALLVERLERKSIEIKNRLEQSNNHWEEAFYISLARSFGFGTNSLPFELLAKSLPLNILGKHKDNLFQLEALLYGQAGLLESVGENDHPADLQREYRFLQTKYKLNPLDGSLWKLLRLRPDNFPHIRIAQFASLINRSSKLFSKIIECEDVKDLRKLFECEVSDYWRNHYVFGKESAHSKKRLGKHSIDILIINTIIPFLFTYKKEKGENAAEVLRLPEKIPAEKNAVVQKWQQLGVSSENAFDSQALIQLKKNYCDLKRCLSCRVGHRVLTVKNKY
ncbi:MAG: DUF2851 family protein [Paludibacteraceae bacterium]